jgi:hypothetical protein
LWQNSTNHQVKRLHAKPMPAAAAAAAAAHDSAPSQAQQVICIRNINRSPFCLLYIVTQIVCHLHNYY